MLCLVAAAPGCTTGRQQHLGPASEQQGKRASACSPAHHVASVHVQAVLLSFSAHMHGSDLTLGRLQGRVLSSKLWVTSPLLAAALMHVGGG